jgi:hypothetical protein
MDWETLEMFDDARELAGVRFDVNSGFRCKRYNTHRGWSASSSHLKGLAADISCRSSRDRMLIVGALVTAGFRRVGIAKTFVHADNDHAKDQEVLWLYD